MPVRFDHIHHNIDTVDVEWAVDIDDRDGTPVSDFCIEKSGVKIHRAGPTLGLMPGIFPSSAEVRFVIENAQHHFLLDDIRTSDSERFTCRIYRDGVLELVGRFSLEGVTYPDKGFPYTITLTVEDGLTSLKNIDYSKTTTERLLDHIKYCFQDGGIENLYSTGDMISFSLDLYESSMGNITANPLNETRISYKAFRDDTTKPAKCFAMLEDMAIAFGCRLYQSRGLFHWEQVALRRGATWRRFYYDSTFTLTSTDNSVSIEKEIDQSERYPQATNIWKWSPPVSKVCIEHRFEQKNFATGLTWDQDDQADKSLGFIQVETDTRLRIKGTFKQDPSLVAVFAESNDVAVARYWWRIRLTIGGTDGARKRLYFDTLNQASFWNAIYGVSTMPIETQGVDTRLGVTAEALLWEDNPTDGSIQMIADKWQTFDESTFALSSGPGLSVGNSYELKMRVSLYKVINPNLVNISGDADYQWDWSLDDVEVSLSTLEPGDTQIIGANYCVPNDVTGNYKPLEFKTRIGDAPESDRGLEIWDGTQWIPSLTWTRDIDSFKVAYPLLRHVSRAMMEFRRTARRVYSGRIIAHDFQYDARYEYQGLTLMPLRGRHSTEADVFRGDMIEVAEDDISGVTGDEPTDISGDNPVPAPAIPPPDWPPGLTPAIDPDNIVTNQDITSTSTDTTIDIENNSGLTIPAGTWLTVTNLNTGEQHQVQLAADMTSSVTQTITIAATTWPFGIPTGMPISIAAVADFEKVIETFTGDGSTTTFVTTGPLSQYDHENWVWVWVEQDKHFYDATPAYGEYNVSSSTDITFGEAPANGSKIRVQYKRPRT